MIAVAAVEERIATVSRSLEEATGGAALCRLDGRSTSEKELEGRVAALLQLRRDLRRGAGTDPRELAEQWRADLASRRRRGSGPAWVAYLAGGVSELESLGGVGYG